MTVLGHRSRYFWAFSLLAVAIIAAPTATAQAQLRVIDADVHDLEGTGLTRIPVKEAVRVVGTVKNEGTDNYTATLTLIFAIKPTGGGEEVYNETYIANVNISADEEKEVVQNWVPQEEGNFFLEVYIDGAYASRAVGENIDVVGTRVVRGNLAERAIDHAPFYLVFLMTLVLFLSVARVRKQRE